LVPSINATDLANRSELSDIGLLPLGVARLNPKESHARQTLREFEQTIRIANELGVPHGSDCRWQFARQQACEPRVEWRPKEVLQARTAAPTQSFQYAVPERHDAAVITLPQEFIDQLEVTRA
jgi:hypothetical protein